MPPIMTRLEKLEKLVKQISNELKNLKAEFSTPSSIRESDIEKSIHQPYGERKTPVEVEHQRKINSRRITKAYEMSQSKGLRMVPAHVSE